jgi:hypothetical protein
LERRKNKKNMKINDKPEKFVCAEFSEQCHGSEQEVMKWLGQQRIQY